jgi:hypothetical protein
MSTRRVYGGVLPGQTDPTSPPLAYHSIDDVALNAGVRILWLWTPLRPVCSENKC